MRRSGGQAALALGALGVVFGDIGTSPLYTVQTLFDPADPHPVAVSPESVYGAISAVFWAGMLVVTITYVLLVMRADNDGEGGIMALITLVRRMGAESGRAAPRALALLGVFGASLFFGDSMITPAISVLSAIEGVEVAAPSVSHLVVIITALILVCLFLLQRMGTGVVGRLFGPVMCVWFTVIALCGIRGIVHDPGILRALSPTYAGAFVFGHFTTGFFTLSAVVLAVTGAEALYADMGHFGRKPVRRMWLLIVFPACTLNYLGQGALVLNSPKAVANPFFLLAPSWSRLPMVFLAAAAAVIASQAVISGAFSVTRQAAQIGYLPRLRIAHTSEKQIGQVYVPWINWALLSAVLVLVFTFKASTALAYAYGVAVTGTITITTLLFFYIARNRWNWPMRWCVAAASPLLAVDVLFFGANIIKLLHGAWLPLLVGVAVFTVLITWQKGRAAVTGLREQNEGPLLEFVDDLHARGLPRVPGTAIFLNRGKRTTPLALRSNVEHNHVLHRNVLIISVETKPVPHVARADRVEIDNLGYSDDRIYHVTARFGYMDVPDVPALLPVLATLRHPEAHPLPETGPENPETGPENGAAGQPDNSGEVSYFLSTIDLHLRPGTRPGLNRWRKRLFIATSRLTADAAEYFRLPRDRTVIMGSRIEI
ncbi:MAG: KUP/HAK/KT family potassium transporter [Nocardiopsaceae bacterium]|nr:KUP/HAK/KT family potassium transporter [Nocardiopsaceae bacterium]